MPYCIETQNLSKSFSIIKSYRDLLFHPWTKKVVTALEDVTIGIREGEIFILLGPNGAGKTTLIKILSTLILPSSGRALVNGLDVTRHGREVRRRIGYVVSDERSFYWRLTGRQNLMFFAALNNLSTEAAAVRIRRLLQFVELEQDADRMFKDYSTGMKQKLAIARGLLTDPDIIFMDEPSKALDPITAHNIRTLVKEMVRGRRKRAVLCATHNLQEAEELCDRIAIISRGSVKYVGTVDALKRTFLSEARYIIRVRDAGNDVVEGIKSIPLIKKLSVLQDVSSCDSIQLEAVLKEGNGNVSLIIEHIIRMGGRISSLHEREPTLDEVFTKVVLG